MYTYMIPINPFKGNPTAVLGFPELVYKGGRGSDQNHQALVRFSPLDLATQTLGIKGIGFREFRF